MLTEEDIVPLEVFDNDLKIELFLQLEDLDKEIWGFVYLNTSGNYLIVMNENLKGKLLREVYDKSIKIIDCDFSFLDYMLYIITKDNLK
ncbi:MAG TPA: hypothetical protein VKN64_10705 [Halanaerobiales bacterium]|nr:hypothetical protein [Halanaerobiales bacterium]